MSLHRNRKLSPFSHLEKSPLLDKLYNITRPPEPPPEPEAEEPAAPSAKPLIFGSGAAGDERAEEPPAEEPARQAEPDT
jgi:hypothetical protein